MIVALNETVDFGHEVSDATERLPTTDTLHADDAGTYTG